MHVHDIKLCRLHIFLNVLHNRSTLMNQWFFPSSQRLVEAAEEAHHQHEENPDLQVRFVPDKRKEKKRGT